MQCLRVMSVCLVWTGLTCVVRGAEEAPELNVRVMAVDASQFPKVSIDVQPRTSRGAVVTELTAEHVEVVENGVKHQGQQLVVQRLSDLDAGAAGRMNAVITIVNSRGLNRKRVGKALSGMIDRLGPKEYACVVTQQDADWEAETNPLAAPRPRARFWQKLTNDKKILNLATRDYNLVGTSALYDVLAFALVIDQSHFSPIIVVSDGVNEGGYFRAEYVIAKSLEKGRPIFCLGATTGLIRKRHIAAPLIRLAEETGGKFCRIVDDRPLSGVYDALVEFRRNQYRVTFESSIIDLERVVRQVSVRISKPGTGSGGAAREVLVPRERVWDEKLRQARARLESLTSAAGQNLLASRASLDQAGLAILRGNKAGGGRDFAVAEGHYDTAARSLADAEQAAQKALDTTARKSAGSEERSDAAVSEALKISSSHRAEAAKLLEEVASLRDTLGVQRSIAKLRKVSLTLPADLESPAMSQVIDFVISRRDHMQPEHYIEIHRLLSRIFSDHVSRQMAAGQYEAAGKLCERAFVLLPDAAEGVSNFGFHLDMARCLAKQSQLAKAVEHYRKAIERDPDNTEVRIELTQALRSLERTDDAMAEAESLAQGDTDSPVAQKLVGEMLYAKQEYSKAAEHLARAAKAIPSANAMLADCHDRLKNTDQAIEAYRGVLKDGNGGARVHGRLACLLYQAGQKEHVDEVVKQARLALAGDGLNETEKALALNVLGICLYNLGSWDEGVRHCVAAVKLKPELAHEHPVLRVSPNE